MTIQELEDIIALVDNKKILNAMKDYRYSEAEKSEKYKDLSVVKIVSGEEERTKWLSAPGEKFEFSGRIYRNIPGEKNVEFIAVSMNRIDHKKDLSIPYSICWFVKEV